MTRNKIHRCVKKVMRRKTRVLVLVVGWEERRRNIVCPMFVPMRPSPYVATNT